MQTRIAIAIVTTLGLVLSLGALTTLCSQKIFAQNSNTGSANGANGGAGGISSGTASYNSNSGQGGAGGGSSGTMTGGGSIGQSGAGGGSSGTMTGGGSIGKSVDRDLFCKTGMITPICK